MSNLSPAAKLPLRASYCVLLLLFTSLTFTSLAFAGGSHEHVHEKQHEHQKAHEHGDPHGHAASNSKAMPAAEVPRLVLQSKQFELVGLLKGKNLQLFLDDYNNNTPVTDAAIKLELAGKTWQAEAQQNGSYLVSLDKELEEGEHSIQATILTKNTTDILTGKLNIHHHAEASEEAEKPSALKALTQEPVWMLAGILLLLLILGVTILRDRQKKGQEK